MWTIISKLIFFFSGWTKDENENIPPEVQRCVIIASPHTSNWDLVYARAAFYLMGIPLRFTIKKEWLESPLGWLVKKSGGLSIDRSPKKPGDPRKSMTQAMIDLFDEHQTLAMMVTPEGTRSLRKEWRMGFYHVAKGAGVPIALGYLDYKRKHAGVAGIIHPSEDMDGDLRKIMAIYKDIAPKHPEKFSVDERYV